MGQAKTSDVSGVVFMLWLEVTIFSFLILGVIGFQIYAWLRVGVWQPVSIITLLVFAGLVWARFPNDWLGIHRALNFVPASLMFFALALPSGIFLRLYYRERELEADGYLSRDR